MKITTMQLSVVNAEDENNTKKLLEVIGKVSKEHNMEIKIDFFTPINDIGDFITAFQGNINNEDTPKDKKESIDDNESK